MGNPFFWVFLFGGAANLLALIDAVNNGRFEAAIAHFVFLLCCGLCAALNLVEGGEK